MPKAYRASDEFGQAIRRRADEIDDFINSVIVPWDETHPNTRSLWANNSLDLPCDRRFVGFADDLDQPPAGLSRNKRRGTLLPVRGKAGDEWRAHQAALSRKPLMGPIFRRFEVADHVLDFNRGIFYRAVIAITPASVWIRCGRELPASPHLVPARLSEFYAAQEAVAAGNTTEEPQP
jgi:hypothetical protein